MCCLLFEYPIIAYSSIIYLGMSFTTDPKVALGSANPQNLIRSLLKSFPDDLDFSDDMQFSQTGSNILDNCDGGENSDDGDDDLSGMLTPIGAEHSISASTPTLSLPESFDINHASDIFGHRHISEAKGTVKVSYWIYVKRILVVVHFTQ